MGQKYAAYDATTGAISAFYDSADSPVPEGLSDFIEVTDEQWSQCISSQGAFVVVNGALEAAAPPDPAVVLAEAKTAKNATLALSCQAAITAGFASSATGAVCTYPSADPDQRNLQSAVSAAQSNAADSTWTTPLWCESAAGEWAFSAHTAAMAQQVNADWVAFRVKAQQAYADLITKVNAAATLADVQTVGAPQ